MNINEIEDLVCFNYSFGVSIEETLKEIDRMDLLYMFLNCFN